jgi:putative flippase GtrA
LGIDTGTSLKIIGISGSLSIVYCVIGLYLLDKIGRIKPLVVSAIGMALALLVNSILSKYYVVNDNPDPNNNALRAMVAMNFVFSLFFTMIGIISWVYPAEVSTHTHLPFTSSPQPTNTAPPDLPSRNPCSGQLPIHLHKLVSEPHLRPMRTDRFG